MKQIKYLFMTLLMLPLLALFTGCSQNEEVSLYPPETYQDANIVSLNFALTAANHYVNTNNAMVRTRSNPIKDAFSINDIKNLPIIHVVNYENGGFVVIAGDKRIEPILAYSDEGYFNLDNSKYLGGLEIWIEAIEERVTYFRENNEAQDLLIKSAWDVFSEETQTRSLPMYEDHCDSLSNVTIGPLVSTQWHQDSPYNNCLPLLSNGNHAYVGCVPVAFAQAMKFFQYPTNYSWNLMPDDSANVYVWELITDIHSLLGSNITYENDGSPVQHNFDKGKFLRQKMGYSNAIYTNYNYSTVESEILYYQRPVILSGMSSSGEGHSWVCDGAHKWETCTESDDGTYYRYGHLTFHCNWGNGASLDGWYSFNNFVMNGTAFNHSLKMTYKIIP